MSESDFSISKPSKPQKPYPEFPLFPHASGQWAKKIRGRLCYFGRWNDPEGALKKYLEQKDALHAGKKPREETEGISVKGVVNAFLNHKKALQESGELSPRSFIDYHDAAELVVDSFGKHRLASDLDPEDFAGLRKRMTRTWGSVRVGDFIQRIRSIFKHAYEVGLLDRPMRFGPGFDRPSRKVIRLERAKKGPKMFEAEELRAILKAATQPLQAMIYLGVNAGLSNSDCGKLPLSAINLETGWIHFPRVKTGVDRRCPLWPETIQSIREALASRPEPKDPAHAGLVFLTYVGGTWHKPTSDNPISKQMRKLLNSLGINGNRNFYALRHVLETIGGEAKDQPALDHLMGHTRNDMASHYRERISDERLKAVADHVHAWLFSEKQEAHSEEEE